MNCSVKKIVNHFMIFLDIFRESPNLLRRKNAINFVNYLVKKMILLVPFLVISLVDHFFGEFICQFLAKKSQWKFCCNIWLSVLPIRRTFCPLFLKPRNAKCSSVPLANLAYHFRMRRNLLSTGIFLRLIVFSWY